MIRVLLVDDDPGMMRVMFLTLKSEGFDVRSASTADEALAIREEFEPDLLITDWLLKNSKDGLFVAQQMVARDPDLPVFFLTGFPTQDLQPHVTHFKTVRVFEKPMRLAEMLSAVRSVFGEPTKSESSARA